MQAAILALGLVVRAWDVERPVDRPSWREEDIAAIARNYAREDMRLYYPRVDWRGDGPGFAEMEFPIVPWAIAVVYRAYGINETAGRVLALGLSIVTLGVSVRLLWRLLPPFAAVAASLFVVLNPVWIRIATALQPEGLMLAAYLIAAYAFLRWLETDGWTSYVVAVCATALAILAKLPALHLGLVFLVWLVWRHGPSALRRRRVWLFGALALAPGVAWYTYAHQFWLEYGNSLGVSNQDHWMGRDLLDHPLKLLSLAKVETVWVWTLPGACLALTTLRESLRMTKTWLLAAVWFGGCLLFYLIAIRTTASDWAAYYHVVSVMPAAILIGLAAGPLADIPSPVDAARRRAAFTFAVAVGATAAVISGEGATLIAWLLRGSGLPPDTLRGTGVVAVIAALALSLAPAVAALQLRSGTPQFRSLGAHAPVVASWLLTAVLLTLTFASEIVVSAAWLVRPWGESTAMFTCVQRFAPDLDEPGLIIASGPHCRDPETGSSIAANAPYMFYWLDRKGFNICVEDQTLDRVEALAARGARYFVAEKGALRQAEGFEPQLRERYAVRAECPEVVVFDLAARVR